MESPEPEKTQGMLEPLRAILSSCLSGVTPSASLRKQMNVHRHWRVARGTVQPTPVQDGAPEL